MKTLRHHIIESSAFNPNTSKNHLVLELIPMKQIFCLRVPGNARQDTHMAFGGGFRSGFQGGFLFWHLKSPSTPSHSIIQTGVWLELVVLGHSEPAHSSNSMFRAARRQALCRRMALGEIIESNRVRARSAGGGGVSDDQRALFQGVYN